MELQGILSQALGNFWCIRGFARLGQLAKVTVADESFQRNLIDTHRDEISSFLKNRRFLFFPEVVLGADLSIGAEAETTLDDQLAPLLEGHVKSLALGGYSISSRRLANRSARDVRGVETNYFVTLEINDKALTDGTLARFSRIDGNHRISAAGMPDGDEFADIVCPFCLLLFRDAGETHLYSRAIFHSINARSIPLRLEQNLRLILDYEDLFPDEDLKGSPSFGWAYYFARRIAPNGISTFDWLPHVKPVMENPDWRSGQPEVERYDLRTRLVELFRLLLEEKILSSTESELQRARDAIAKVHGLYADNTQLRDGKNPALFAVLVAFSLVGERTERFIIKWALENHIHLLRSLDSLSLYRVVKRIIESRRRKIFVSMPFGRDITEHHWTLIWEACDELSRDLNLSPALVPERVDWFADGTSYSIPDRILDMIDECGLLIGNLTHARNNVYHEIGFVMGRNRALGQKDNLLLILESGDAISEDEKRVGFNLQGLRQLRFDRRQDLKPRLKTELCAFFKLPSPT